MNSSQCLRVQLPKKPEPPARQESSTHHWIFCFLKIYQPYIFFHRKGVIQVVNSTAVAFFFNLPEELKLNFANENKFSSPPPKKKSQEHIRYLARSTWVMCNLALENPDSSLQTSSLLNRISWKIKGMKRPVRIIKVWPRARQLQTDVGLHQENISLFYTAFSHTEKNIC